MMDSLRSGIDGFFGAFVHPWLLFGLLLTPLIWWLRTRRRGRAALQYSSLALVQRSDTGWGRRGYILLPILRCLAFALLVISVARPRSADEQTRIKTEGIAIELVVDRSGSMAQPDFKNERGREQTRLDAVKHVVRSFLLGDNKNLPGRPDDLVGLLVFARYADALCPPTNDHEYVVNMLQEVKVPERWDREEDGTAIGDALLQAIERIRDIGRRLGDGGALKITSRVIILLTDGEQNRGEFKPGQAAEVAAAIGVKIYTIGAAPEYQNQSFGGFFGPQETYRVPIEIDEETLKKVAETTGAKYFRATDQRSLESIYAEIDKLERTVIDEQRYELYTELAINPIELGRLRLPPLLLIALCVLGIEVLLANTRFRRIP